MNSIILIVEDNPIIALEIKEILKKEGYNAITNLTSVEEAIKAIKEYQPMLVLIDINLKKEKDGIDLGKYLLENDKTPFVYVSSQCDKITLERVNETRPYGFIVKPFKPSDITTTVSIVLNNNKHRNIDVVRQEAPINDDVPFLLKQTIQYINDNISEKIKMADLVSNSRWKSQHFNRLFAKYMGVTPYQYILNRKIDKAKALLSESTIPTRQISFDLGFSSHSGFCIAFKKTTEKTPETYRKLYNLNRNFL